MGRARWVGYGGIVSKGLLVNYASVYSESGVFIGYTEKGRVLRL